jgi:hypothetical protein
MKKLLINILLVIGLVAAGTADLCAEQKNPGEYQVKALFLYNFINFVDWPADSTFSSSPTINVCIVGDDPFDEGLNEIRNETVKGKRVSIRFYRPFEEHRGCNLLFIPHSEENHVESILRSIREPGVLTVGDTEESARQGAVIGFFMEQKKVHFAVNIEAARRAGLKISAKLLKLAKIIKPTDN